MSLLSKSIGCIHGTSGRFSAITGYHERTGDFDVFSAREQIQKQKVRFRNQLKITNGEKKFWVRTASLQEANWMADEIKKFLDELFDEKMKRKFI